MAGLQPELFRKEVWRCWRRCITQGAGFEISEAWCPSQSALFALVIMDQDVSCSDSSSATPLNGRAVCHDVHGLCLSETVTFQ